MLHTIRAYLRRKRIRDRSAVDVHKALVIFATALALIWGTVDYQTTHLHDPRSEYARSEGDHLTGPHLRSLWLSEPQRFAARCSAGRSAPECH